MLRVCEGMKTKKKGDFFTKVVKFGAKSLTLYSLDGNTWSTRCAELKGIMERHEAERQKLLQNMSEVKAQEEAETGPNKEEEKEEPEHDDGPMIVGQEADIDLTADDEGGDEDEAPAPKAASKVAKRVLPTALTKQKRSPKSPKGKEKVAFVTPKPRQIGKKKVKTAPKGKKRSAA